MRTVSRQRLVLVTPVVLFGALFVGSLTWVVSPPDKLWIRVLIGAVLGALAGLGTSVFILLTMRAIRDAVAHEAREVRAFVNIRPMVGESFLTIEGFAIDPILAELLVQSTVDIRPHLVLECGSGTSTVLIGAALRAIGRGRLVALEHDPMYAERTRERLRELNLGGWAEVRDAPLQPVKAGGLELPWYDVNVLGDLRGETAELLFVDGPPGRTAELARYPALPVLLPFLAKECVVILDDGKRRDEKSIAERWAAETGASVDELPTRKGALKLVLA